MSVFEKRVAIGAAAITLLMLIVPPWQAQVMGTTFNLGYRFIALGPETGTIDLARLAIQILIVGGVAYGLTRFYPPR